MRVIALLFVCLLSIPAMAQPTPETINNLVERLNALTHRPQAAMSADGGVPETKPVLGVVGPEAEGATRPAATGWNSDVMRVCIAAIIGSNQYVVVGLASGNAAATQSTVAIPVIAANCASGKTFFYYLEANGSVSAIASSAQ